MPANPTHVPTRSPIQLEGPRVRLEPLVAEHVRPLAEAASEDRSSYAFTWVPDGVEDAHRYVEAALDDQVHGRAVPFAVRRLADDRIVGCTRFLDLQVFTSGSVPWPPGAAKGGMWSDDQPPTVAEIGSTWYAASTQRSGVNAECKLLMLGYAFDTWKVIRVTLKTDARNRASRLAIQRLGAQAEGVRRAHSPTVDATVRDTAYYSILAGEWPDVRAGLEERLALHAP
jgi:N-acetyltransferase